METLKIAALSRSEAARYLSVSERYIDRLAASGKLQRIKLGRKTVFSLRDLDALLEASRYNCRDKEQLQCQRNQ